MFRNYIKTALKFVSKDKLFLTINIFGLSIALAVSFIILLFVINEMSYDHVHKNRSQTYRVLNSYSPDHTISTTPYILASSLKEEFPQVEEAINVMQLDITFKVETGSIPASALGTESNIFDIFTINLAGNSPRKNLIDDKASIVISKELANKVFGFENVVGESLHASVNNEDVILKVTGVFDNLPVNSTLKADCFLNSKWTTESLNKKFNISNSEIAWDKHYWITWIMLAKKVAPEMIEQQFGAFEVKKIGEKPGSHYSLQNLSDVYLKSDNVINTGLKGSLSKVEIFSAIALLILIVATLNYILLSTAISTTRKLEIGIRKTYGASIRSIRLLVFTESYLTICIVLPAALILMMLMLPVAGKLFQTNLILLKSNIIIYILTCLALSVILGLVSGIYTTAYLSNLNVLDILKNTFFEGKRKQLFRSSLIVVQLVIFCSVLSCMFIIRSQYMYLLNKDIGFYNKDVVLISLGNDFKDYTSYLNTLKSYPDVIMAAGTMEGMPMVNNMSIGIPNPADNTKIVNVEIMGVGDDFIETMGIKVKEGRSFSKDFPSDLSYANLLLNEKAVRELNMKDPVGKVLTDQTVIGVVNDFNLHSLYTEIPPLAIVYSQRKMKQIVIHYKHGALGNLLAKAESEWKKIAPDKPFSYKTIDETIETQYSTEKNLTSIVTIFAILTMLISAFGLFGLTLFIARSRTKELGVRKVFGSSASAIIASFLKTNFILTTLATIISIPFTIHFMTKWLIKFPYRVNINASVFILVYLIALALVLATVIYHTYKSAQENTINALRHV